MSTFDYLIKQNLIKDYPSFIKNNIHYEVQTGSVSYGVSSDNSDLDILGFCIPPKHIIFPHLDGKISFFDHINYFEQFQKHHIFDASCDKNYDITIYSIIKYFKLCINNNPNIIDSIFVPRRCILHSTQIGEHVRENRKLFLHKGAWHKFKSYSYSQLHKIKTKYKRIDDLYNFEKNHNLNSNTTIADIEKEINNRGLKI